MPSFDPVIAVVRALTVLRIVNALGIASIKQIHAESKLHRSTVLRMLETLAHEGYITRDETTGYYMPTGKTLLLSNGFQGNLRLSQLAAPILEKLRAKIGWPSDVAILDGDAMFVVITSREFSIVALNYKAGERAPILLSSLGRAYLAFCGDARRGRIIDMLAQSKRSIDAQARTDRNGLERMLTKIRKQGYATPDATFNRSSGAGLATGFSVPVFRDDEVFCSLSVAFLSSAMTLEKGIETLLPSLQEASSKLGAAISAEYR